MKKYHFYGLLAAWLVSTGVQAATFAVNDTADLPDDNLTDNICHTSAGFCSLRAAIDQANALPDDDTIVLPTGNYTLTLPGVLYIGSNITINGESPSTSIISGGGTRAVLTISGDAVVNLNKLALTQGNGAPSSVGGALSVGSGTTTLTEVLVSNSTATGAGFSQGGGIYVNGTGTLYLLDSTVMNNSAANGGGGIGVASGGAVHVIRSTISGNSTTNLGANGGGIDVKGQLEIVNSTVSGNTANTGSGIGVSGDGSANILFTTIAYNTATSANSGQLESYTPNSTSIVSGSIIANPTGGVNCASTEGSLTSSGYNLSSDDSCAFMTAQGDLTHTDPLQASLGFNGYINRTHALLTGSPAINAGPTLVPVQATTDQNHKARVQAGRADIGAYEATAAIVVNVGNASITEGNAGTTVLDFPISLSAPAPSGGITITWSTADGTAAASSDYVAVAGGQVTIPAGDNSGSLTVTINGDIQVEPNETFTVTLDSIGAGASIGTSTATGTIANDDSLPQPGNPEIGAARAVPTLSEWGLLLLAGLLGAMGWRDARARGRRQ
ncbi:IPTL-CTERM sorting domain-containing protein [Diaphorobacter sp. HDW4A]|uniref:IPTL-CTERM sorting domain-containing protein n=1 Tax=Diaphorobacter sp. HDW4A TaxID=2714924 RepID=UPI00140BD857|nr:IPTL-CTERM sorting domain-containing protein [Diaphorobacter sp. HDW4A]QIL79568.1 IPTL-CTERM sorting domain-containing protein [Diaphorobacter sp. HDW4A]